MVIQVERFLSVQKYTRLYRSLTDCALVLAEEPRELGTYWRKGTSSNDWENPEIWSSLAMFVCVTSYLKAVFCHRPLELDCSSGMTSLHSSAGQRQIYPTLPTWHLPWVVVLPWFPHSSV